VRREMDFRVFRLEKRRKTGCGDIPFWESELAMDYSQIIKDMFYFLAILNPPSKLLFLSAYEPPLSRRQTMDISWKSSLAAFLILVIFSLAGRMLLRDIFRIDLFALRICGGLILFFTGWLAVREGHFSQQKDGTVPNINEISIIPLATPLITGPGTITIGLALTTEHGSFHAIVVMLLAILLNFALMAMSLPINHVLKRLHLTGPLIRITGLIVATVAIQMILTGLQEWVRSISGS